MPDYSVLGPLVVRIDGNEVVLGGARQRATLAVLILHRNTVVSTDRLIDFVWGEDPPATSATALQGHISQLRRLLGAGAIETRPTGYVLPTEPGDTDIDRFEALVAAAGRSSPRSAAGKLREALAMVRGPAFGDLASEPAAVVEAARLEEVQIAALEARIEADLATGQHEALVAELESFIADHPYRERLRAQLMIALYRSGRQAEALAVYGKARSDLDEGLGIDPSPELQALEAQILQQDPDLAAPSDAGEAPTSLPTAASSLVGRKAELADIRMLFAGRTRLVTITGPGGTGKTRLALEAAAALRGEDPDGAWFIDLAAATRGEEAIEAIRAGIGLADRPDVEPLADLRASLGPRRILLVLDNLEQVLEVAGPIASLLEAAPGLRVIATSRAPLAIGGETQYPLVPLATGAPDDRLDLDRLPDAVALFIDRARAANPGFSLDAATFTTVADLCRQLDGLPLAIELAAAMTRLLTPAAILARIRSGATSVRSTRRDLAPRQQSLEAAIAWSEDLLGPAARRAFRRAAVFAGGFGLDAFSAVCSEPGDDPLDVLGELVDHSLIQRRGSGEEPRFGMLETIRVVAGRHLAAESDAAEIQFRHLRFHQEFAIERSAELHGPGEERSLIALRLEHDNVRAALIWAAEQGHLDDLAGLAAAISTFWVRDSHYREGQTWLRRAAASAGAGTAAERGTILRDLATIAETMGHVGDAIALATESIAAWEVSGDRRGLASALRVASMSYNDAGDSENARRCASLALHHAESVGDERLIVAARHELAFLAAQGDDLDTALQLLQANAADLRRVGDQAWLGGTLSNIGQLHQERGDLALAEQEARAALAIFRVLEDPASRASSLTILADILTRADRLDEARSCLVEGIAISLQSDATRELPPALETLADVSLRQGDPASTVMLLGRAAAMRVEAGLAETGGEIAAILTTARAALGEDLATDVWATGTRLSVDDLLVAVHAVGSSRVRG